MWNELPSSSLLLLWSQAADAAANAEVTWMTVLQTCTVLVIFNCLLQFLVIRPWHTRVYGHPPFYAEFPYIPGLGSVWQFATNPREFLQRARIKCGPVFTIQLFGRNMTFLFDRAGHAHFFRAPETVFDIRKAYAMTVTTFGPGVCYDVPQSRMAEQFAFFKDGLSDTAFVKYMVAVQDEVSTYFTTEWGNEGTADLLHSLSNVFTLTSSRCLLGQEIRTRWKDSGMAEHYFALDHSFVPILFFFPNLPNPHRSKCIAARKLFEKIFDEVMQERRRNNAEAAAAPSGKNYTPPRDFLQDLMEATYKDGTKPTPTEITGILIGVLLGGQHTSNVTGTWILVHLLKNKEWFDRVMAEQESIFQKKKKMNNTNETTPGGGSCSNSADLLLSPATLTFDDINHHMPVFEQVFMEVLRLHHPFFQLSRFVQEDSVFEQEAEGGTKKKKKTIIPAGHYVNVAPSAAMRTPQLFPDRPQEFDPSRFAADNKEQLPPYTFIGFGGGMHQCGGRKFAWNSLKASISWILRNYDLELIGAGATSLPGEDYTTMVVAPTTAHVQVRYKRKTTTTAATTTAAQ